MFCGVGEKERISVRKKKRKKERKEKKGKKKKKRRKKPHRGQKWFGWDERVS